MHPQWGDPRLPERFWAKVSPEPNSGCWLWTSAVTADDYGVFWISKTERSGRVHRLAFEFLVGPIPVGLQIDHLCRVRSCCNPSHLEPVTALVNSQRSLSITAINAIVMECPRGHIYDAANTRVGIYRGRPARTCRSCQRIHQAAYRARLKEAA